MDLAELLAPIGLIVGLAALACTAAIAHRRRHTPSRPQRDGRADAPIALPSGPRYADDPNPLGDCDPGQLATCPPSDEPDNVPAPPEPPEPLEPPSYPTPPTSPPRR